MKLSKVKSTVDDSAQKIQKAPPHIALLTEIAVGITICFGAFYLFLEMSERVLEKEKFFFDSSVSMFFYDLRSPLLTSIMRFFSFIGMDGIIVLSALIPLFFIWKKRKNEAIFFTIMIGLGAVINYILKLILLRPRPDFDPLAVEKTFSFPSGHSMNSFIFFMTLAYFYYHFTKNKKHAVIAFSAASIIVLLIGVSRIYLGVHYPSDVVGGYIAGLFWLFFVIVIDRTINFWRLVRKT